MQRDGRWVHYHPDPYAGQPWNSNFIHQCLYKLSESGEPVNWRADRQPGQTLLAAGLKDTAALVNKPWQRTVGHYSHADMGSREIDGHRVTSSLASAVIDCDVVKTDLTRAASDHLPKVTTLDLSRLR
ncbi:hypothetical protein AB0I53_32895 [Saccharopolyspora sp. NPDC050389]|uniref:hypothetical protein n=1 Tax=Saccharopolyspora sp. NPDC050389 TaxID=3155516 RepID=UPI0033CE5021